jgi:hypothetical protein
VIARRVLVLGLLAAAGAWGQTALPTVIVSGLPAIGVAATQPTATVSLSKAYSLTVSGTMTLTFTPTGGSAQEFDAKFASGGTTTTFTITPTVPTASVPVIIGTVAGIITITTNATDSAGNSFTPVITTLTVNGTVPVVTKVTFGAVTNGTFTISVTGRSTPRDMTSALFHFALPTNTQPSTLDVTVPLSSAFTAWYGRPSSVPFGSTFTATIQFSFTGPPGSTVPFTAVTVTMTNLVGASNAFGPTNP